ncbi:MAG: PQQ-binding-like beta-propeller repeat protein [Pirellulaceae bacterium]|nr:PQQ-like beta-propeller repeat protein [Planctomycetales bacterium]
MNRAPIVVPEDRSQQPCSWITLPRRVMGIGILGLTLLTGLVFSTASRAGDWPAFLGPTRDGKSDETQLVEGWDEQGPRELWRVPGGIGMSGLAIANGLVVTLVQDDDAQRAIALDLKTGAERWSTELAPAYINAMGNGPRATPAIDDDRVYVFTGDGILVALATADGEELWRHEPLTELGGREAEYGMASSPLIVGDRVLVTVGADQGLLVAYDKKSGDLAWSTGSDRAGYSSPVVRTLGTGDDAAEQLIAFSATSVQGFSPDDGSRLWSYDWETPYDCNIAVPLAIDGDLLISSGENHGTVRLRIERTNDGWGAREIWSSQGPRAMLRSEWQTGIQLDGYLYGFDNVGSAGPITHFSCIDLASGERVWQEQRFGKGNAIAADGKLFATTMDGDLVLIRASSEGYEELGRATVHGGTRQAPALSQGVLLVRDDQEIIAFDVRQ